LPVPQYMIRLLKAGFLSACALFVVIQCVNSVEDITSDTLNEYLHKAELFYIDEQIDSAQHYVNLCFDIKREYPPAQYIQG